MRPALLTASLLAILLSSAPARTEAQGTPAPRLVVILVVDQMRTDYFDLGRQYWRGGFRRLLGEGAFFQQGEYPYLNTPSHAPGMPRLAPGRSRTRMAAC